MDIEEIVIKWLSTIITDWNISGDKPIPSLEKYIVVDRTGGPRESMVLDRAEILIDIYAKSSRKEAKDEAYYIADHLHELLLYSDNITHAEINSVVHLDDSISKYRRYRVYCDIYHRR